MENKKEPQAIQYFFRLLDIEGHGYLTAFSLQYFFRVSMSEFESCKLYLYINLTGFAKTGLIGTIAEIHFIYRHMYYPDTVTIYL